MSSPSRRALFIQAAIPLLLLCAGCATPSLSARARAAWLELDGDAGTSLGPVSAGVDTDSLGLDDREAAFAPSVDFDWDPLHLTVEGIWVEYEGSGVAEADLDLGGTLITLGEPVDSKLDLGLYQARLAWDFIPDPLFDLGVGVGVGLLDVELEIDSATGPGSIAVDDDLPYAFLTARVAKKLGPIELQGRASGLGVEFEDEDLDYIDLEGVFLWHFWSLGPGSAALELGYRHIELDYDSEEFDGSVETELTLSGPFAGLTARL